MEILDVISILFWLVMVLLGYKRGWFFETLMLFVMAASVVLSFISSPAITRVITSFPFEINENQLNSFLFMISVIFYFTVINFFSSKTIETLSKKDNLPIFSRIGGCILSLFRGFIYAGFIFSFITMVTQENNDFNRQIKNGKLTSYSSEAIIMFYDSIKSFVNEDSKKLMGLIKK